MNQKIEFVSEKNIAKIDDIENNFRYSLNINAELENEINSVCKRALLNIGKANISLFNLKYMDMFENLASQNSDDKELKELSKSIIKHIDNFFKELDSSLNIQNSKDLHNLNYILQLSSLILDDAAEDKDIELTYESFFQIERRIKKESLSEKFQ